MTTTTAPTLDNLAAQLGVSPLALHALGLTRNCVLWECPERDDHGTIIGWATRDDAGNKKSKLGSKRGLTYVHPIAPQAGESLARPLLICEGMSDTAAAFDLDFDCIGRPSAAGGLQYLPPLVKGKDVAVLGENDSGAGKLGAEKTAAAIHKSAASVRIVYPPDGAKDLRAWFTAPAPVTRAELLRLIERTEPWQPPAQSAKPAEASRLCTVRLADVQPEALRWLWPGRIPLGKLTLLYGDPGLGKSFLTLDIAARVSTGNGWPDIRGERGEPGGVLLLTAEDGLADTVRPRLDAAGADVARIEAIEAVGIPGGGERALSLDDDLRLIEERIAERGDVKLFIIDPISAYCGKADSHTNAEVRGMLAPIAKLAERRGVAIIAVSHLNKGAGGRAMYRAMGSLAFIAAARAGWLVVEDESDPAKRFMLPTKMNLAAKPSGMAFSLHDSGAGVPSIAWSAEPVDLSADDALAAIAGHGDDERTGREDAADWLRAALADGPMKADDVKRQAKQNSISERTLNRAKAGAGVLTKREGFGPGATWYWSLPDHHRLPTDPIDCQPLGWQPMVKLATYGGEQGDTA